MRFGQLHLFEQPAGRSEREIIAEQMDIMLRAEDYGFDSVWPAEHHFREYGHCATPALTLAALAMQTKTIRLGTGVVVLPLNHPVRVAEDYAFLDILSNGRIDLGIGRGYQPHEYQGYGVDQSRSRDIFRESVEVIQKAWTEDSFSYDGEFYQVENLTVHPKPQQQPHPPIWMASVSTETFEICGRFGYNLLCSPIFGFNVQTGATQIEQYRAALRAHGREPKQHGIGAVSLTYVAETTQQALADIKEGVMWYMKTFQKYVAPPKGQAPVPTFELYAQIRDLLDLAEFDLLVKAGAVVAGSPDEVVQQIGQMSEQCGFTDYLAWTRVGGLAHDKVMRCMELMGSKVIPQLRGVGAAAASNP
jgi:alkanesulfonate monooxygenase SsuD/methylene tetrahydromethanopterin reductase-like flavin-dependent oxidoreductase (luciferase family)